MKHYNMRFVRDKPLIFKIIYFLYHNDGEFTREHLTRMIAKPRTTVFDNLQKPIKEGMINKYERYAKHQTKGRPRVYYQLNDDFREYVEKYHADLINKKVIF